MPERIDNPVFESARVVGHYIKAQLLIALITSVLYAIGFRLAQLPWWPLVAVANGLAHLVPRFGGMLGLAALALSGLLGEIGLGQWAAALGAWVAVQGIEGFFLTPKIMGNRLGLSPFVVFLVLLAGGFMLGPVGLLIAVPAAAVVNVFWRYFRQRRKTEV